MKNLYTKVIRFIGSFDFIIYQTAIYSNFINLDICFRMKKYLNSLKLTKKKKDNRFSKNNIDKILNDITEEIAMDTFSTPPSQPLVHAVMDKVKCTRESLFVGG